MNLSFNNSGQSEDLEYFPVVVNLSSVNFDYSKVNLNFSDLRFIDDDGSTELSYEVEKWDVNGVSTIWVNVTSITGSSTTDHIHMYYNNSEASPGEDPTGVWDDDFLLVHHLEEDGHEVVTATDGRDGLKMILENPPHVCLVDLMMPGMDGLQLTTHILQQAPDLDDRVLLGDVRQFGDSWVPVWCLVGLPPGLPGQEVAWGELSDALVSAQGVGHIKKDECGLIATLQSGTYIFRIL